MDSSQRIRKHPFFGWTAISRWAVVIAAVREAALDEPVDRAGDLYADHFRTSETDLPT